MLGDEQADGTVARDTLASARAALARHDWQRGHDLALGLRLEDPSEEAERLDLLAEAAWWLGQLDACIDARERAFRAFEELGDQRRAGRCAVWLYEHYCFRARPAIASGWLQRARRALEDDVESVEHGALLLREAELAHGRGRARRRGDAGPAGRWCSGEPSPRRTSKPRRCRPSGGC